MYDDTDIKDLQAELAVVRASEERYRALAGFLQKPFRASRLIEAVGRIIENRR